MQRWVGLRGRCILCSLREVARERLCLLAKRPFATTADRSRSRPHERILKGRWKESILMPSRAEELKRTSRSSLLRSSKYTGGQMVIRTQEGHRPATELELLRLRNTLQDRTAQAEKLSPYVALDPDLLHFDAFETKVAKCLGKEGKKAQGAGFGDPLQVSLEQAFIRNGRIGIRKVLLFAYIDHIIETQQKTGFTSTTPTHVDLRYPTEWYRITRTLQREIHLHVGPTNSGKTYQALKRLEEAGSGIYAGPLRLLAHEVFRRFNNKGIPCDLVTGDDVRTLDNDKTTNFASYTVEMVSVVREVEVAVIDEIQMIASDDRGWAWTRALLGTRAKELHLCGETRVIPLIRELAASMGDRLHIHHYDRLNPLKAMRKSLRGDLRNLRRGDCIVVFSVAGIHAMKKRIEKETGRRVAIVYGKLPPEIRAQQAALFNDPNNDYDFLVASDAIGMGLNLSIKRIIFESIRKIHCGRFEKLSVSQIKQISGRAGRYRIAPSHPGGNENGEESKVIDSQDSQLSSFKGSVKQSNVGLVSCLEEEDLPEIQAALNSEAEPIKAASILPPAEFIDEFASTLPPGIPFEYVLDRIGKSCLVHPRFSLSDMREQKSACTELDEVGGLNPLQSYIISAGPSDSRSDVGRKVLRALASCVAKGRAVTVIDVPEIPLDVLDLPLSAEHDYLEGLEHLHKSLIFFLWLSYRFPNIFLHQGLAKHTKDLVEEKINSTLLEFSANPKLTQRLLAMREAKIIKDASQQPSSAKVRGAAGPGPVEDEEDVMIEGSSTLPIDWANGKVRVGLKANGTTGGPEEYRQPETLHHKHL